MSNLVKVFNDHLIEFLDDVITIFPENTDIQTGRTFIIGIKKVNPKKIIKSWLKQINSTQLRVLFYSVTTGSSVERFFCNFAATCVFLIL